MQNILAVVAIVIMLATIPTPVASGAPCQRPTPDSMCYRYGVALDPSQIGAAR